MGKKITLEWHCGYYVGESHWHGTEVYEPDECDTVFTTQANEDDWSDEEERNYITAVCPRCGAVLDAEFDEPEPLEETAPTL